MKLETLAARTSDNGSTNRALFRNVLTNIIKPSWKQGPWVAGGSVRRYVCNLEHSDFDVFFYNSDQHQQFVERLRRDFKVVSERSTNTNTTLCVEIAEKTTVTIQAIRHAYYGSPEAVIDSFDFTICQWITDGDELVVGEFTLWDTARRRLALHNVTLAVSTLRRILKYSNQGFTACSGMMSDFLQRVAANPEIINQNVISVD